MTDQPQNCTKCGAAIDPAVERLTWAAMTETVGEALGRPVRPLCVPCTKAFVDALVSVDWRSWCPGGSALTLDGATPPPKRRELTYAEKNWRECWW